METSMSYNTYPKQNGAPGYLDQNMPYIIPSAPINAYPPSANVPVTYITQHLAVGPHTQTMVCPGCRQTIKTVIRHRTTTRTHGMACLLYLVCCLPCMCIPYCMDTCRNTNHFCPNCDTFIGTYTA